MSTRPRLLFSRLALVGAALGSAACSAPTPPERAFATDPIELPAGDSATVDGNDGAGLPREVRSLVTDVAPGRIRDRACLTAATRCGVVLVPQAPHSPELIEVPFEVVRERGPQIPVVVLRAPDRALSISADDFPGRPVIVLGSRDVWPGGPAPTCAELTQLDDQASAVQIADATRACTTRIAASAFDLTVDPLARNAHDIVAALLALGFAEVDIVAVGARAATVAPVQALAPIVRRVVYVDPDFASTAPAHDKAMRATRAFTAIWEACDNHDTCETAGTPESFLDAVAAVATNPPPGLRPDITADLLLAAAIEDAEAAPTALALPELHHQLTAGDTGALADYANQYWAGAALPEPHTTCWRMPPVADLTGVHPLVAALATSWHDDATTICDAWAEVSGPTRAAARHEPLPGLMIVTASNAQTERADDSLHPVIVEPSVGPPTRTCAITAATAWLDDERTDSSGCTTGIAADRRTQTFSLIDGIYIYDDNLRVRTRVPDSWTDWGSGTWYRDADADDLANLDVYLWDNHDPRAARKEMAADWGLVDPTEREFVSDTTSWLLATGAEDDSDQAAAELAVSIAVARIDNVTVALVLTAPADELEALTSSVLEPALAGTSVVR